MTKLKDLIADCDDTLAHVELSKISVNKKERTMSVELSDTTQLTEAQLLMLKNTFITKYRLDDINIQIPSSNVVSEVMLRQQAEQDALIKQFESQLGTNKPSEVICGKKIKGKLLSLDEVTPEAGRVRTSGEIFCVEWLERKDHSWILTFDITDKKDSRTVKLFLQPSTTKKCRRLIWTST